MPPQMLLYYQERDRHRAINRQVKNLINEINENTLYRIEKVVDKAIFELGNSVITNDDQIFALVQHTSYSWIWIQKISIKTIELLTLIQTTKTTSSPSTLEEVVEKAEYKIAKIDLKARQLINRVLKIAQKILQAPDQTCNLKQLLVQKLRETNSDNVIKLYLD